MRSGIPAGSSSAKLQRHRSRARHCSGLVGLVGADGAEKEARVEPVQLRAGARRAAPGANMRLWSSLVCFLRAARSRQRKRLGPGGARGEPNAALPLETIRSLGRAPGAYSSSGRVTPSPGRIRGRRWMRTPGRARWARAWTACKDKVCCVIPTAQRATERRRPE